MVATVETNASADTLWVLVQVKDTICALNSTCVEAISLLEDEITQMPSSDDVHLGIIQFRNSVLPMVDLRRLLGLQSRGDEFVAFEKMLDARKQDHLNWVAELRRCAQEHAAFSLATDPHKCAFGKWYDQFQAPNQNIAFQFKKVELPHRKLHETAITVLSAAKDEENGQAQIAQILSQETDVYKAQVLSHLDGMKQTLRDNVHKMFLVISDGSSTCGLLVDEVLAVESLLPIAQPEQPSCVDTTSLVAQIAQRKSDRELVMVLNQEQVFAAVPQMAAS